jgi:hypothetical protein
MSWRFTVGYSPYGRDALLRVAIDASCKGLKGFVFADTVPANWMAVKVTRSLPTAITGVFITTSDPEFSDLKRMFQTPKERDLELYCRLIDSLLPEQCPASADGRVLVHDSDPFSDYTLFRSYSNRLARPITTYPTAEECECNFWKLRDSGAEWKLVHWYRFLRKPVVLEEYLFYGMLMQQLMPYPTETWEKLQRLRAAVM